jgi:hypothetical protein
MYHNQQDRYASEREGARAFEGHHLARSCLASAPAHRESDHRSLARRLVAERRATYLRGLYEPFGPFGHQPNNADARVSRELFGRNISGMF